uniref:Uncharacterized protein n=1 Tax=Macrostomum lignano TaxID=282301 RepID=A0A1I8FNP4_9PLAT
MLSQVQLCARATVSVAMEPVPQRTWDCPGVHLSGTGGADPGCEMCATERARIGAPPSGASSDEKRQRLDSREPTGQRRRGQQEGCSGCFGRGAGCETAAQQQQAGSRQENLLAVGIFCCRLQNCPLASPGSPGPAARELLRDRKKPPRPAVAGVTSQMNYARSRLSSCHLRPRSARLAAWLHHGRAQSRQSGHRRPAQPPPCLQLVQDGSFSVCE